MFRTVIVIAGVSFGLATGVVALAQKAETPSVAAFRLRRESARSPGLPGLGR